ncbi:MAG: carbohydrate porin [Hyphomicrobium sp.]|jgi:porin|nr:carbohydrate porin [Hyphomicrobium sp.]
MDTRRRGRRRFREAICCAGSLIAYGLLPASAAVAGDDVSGLPEVSIGTSLPPGLADPGGIRRDLARRGILVGANYIGEYFGVASGGLNQDGHYDGRLELWVDVDLGKMAGWNGLTFHANGYQIHGSSITAESVGSLMPVSFIEATPATRLFEVYLEQTLLDGKISIRAGQIAADSEFIISDGASALLNGTWGWPSITAADLPNGGPAYPLPAPGVRIAITPSETYGVMGAVFNGDVVDDCGPDEDPQQCNAHGLDFPFGDGALFMAEAFYRYATGALPGRVKIGGWYHTGEFENLADPSIVETGDHGIYAIWDQVVTKLDGEGRNIAVFARVAGAPGDQNEVDFYAEGGLTVTGPLASRPNDLFGIGFAYTGISDAAVAADRDAGLPVVRNYEALLEASYTAVIVPGFSIQPDLQYFWNPGAGVPDEDGTGQVENALVLGVRSTVNY